MFVEPPRAPGAARRPATTGVVQTQARPSARPALAPAGVAATKLPVAVRDAALAAAAALVATGRGDIWTLAVAFGVSDASAITSLVVALVGVATIARTGSAALGDVAGAQAVLGAAAFTGSAVAIGAAWASAASLVLASRDRWTGVVLGAFGGTLVAGPSLSGGRNSVAVWIGGVAVGGFAGFVCAANERRERWQPWVAVTIAVGAIGLGLAAGYR